MPLKEWLPSSDEMNAKPWGLWATLGFSAIIFALFCALQILVAIAFVSLAKAKHPELDLEVYAKSLSSNGFCIAIMSIVSGLICTPLTLLFTKLHKSISVKNYIGFKEPLKREWAQWFLILAAFLFLSDGISLLLHQTIVPPFSGGSSFKGFGILDWVPSEQLESLHCFGLSFISSTIFTASRPFLFLASCLD
jgi:hypothetical protein